MRTFEAKFGLCEIVWFAWQKEGVADPVPIKCRVTSVIFSEKKGVEYELDDGNGMGALLPEKHLFATEGEAIGATGH